MLAWPQFPSGLRLTPEDLDGVVQAYGVSTTIRRAVACDCVDPATRNASETCGACRGWGLRYPAELGLTLPVQWVGRNAQTADERIGTVEPGDYTVTWQSDQALAPGDVFVHPTEEAVVTGELLTRGETDPVGSAERLRYENVTAVERVQRGDLVFAEGVDWQLNGQAIEWLPGGAAPASGSLYGVRYRYRAQYAIWSDPPQKRMDADRLTWTAKIFRLASLSRQEGALGGM